MKRLFPVLVSLITLQIMIPFPLVAQDPDGWEDYQTNLQPPETVIPAIDLKEGMIVGEIGAGRGRYSVILAKYVGKKGHIYANDIDAEDLEYLDFRCERDEIENITTIQGRETDPLLPENKLDMIFIVNSFHHFSHPTDLLKNACPALKASGTLVIIEGVPGRYGSNSTHATPKEDVISRTEMAGFKFDRVAAELEKDNIYIFKKK